MIEGGRLGVVSPEEIGPADVQVANGVIDIAVAALPRGELTEANVLRRAIASV